MYSYFSILNKQCNHVNKSGVTSTCFSCVLYKILITFCYFLQELMYAVQSKPESLLRLRLCPLIPAASVITQSVYCDYTVHPDSKGCFLPTCVLV